jgi:predicted secreted protein with PEFG-CTERM motif
MNLKLIAILAIAIGCSLVGSAYAHKSQVIGEYKIEAGWETEPPIVGQSNKIVVNVSMATEDDKTGSGMNMTDNDHVMDMTDEEHDSEDEHDHEEEHVENGISDLSEKLEVDITLNGKKEFLSLEEDSDNIGHYTSPYTPMEAGFPIVHIFGTINEDEIEVTIHPEKVEMEGEHAEETHVSGMSSDGTVNVDIDSSIPKSGDPMSIRIKFTDMDGNLIDHINHDIIASQDGKEVLTETAAHQHEGEGRHMTKSLVSDDPVDIQVKILGIGLPDDDPTTWTGPKGDVISLQVVPEFGPLAIIILAISVVSIIALSTKIRSSKILTRI